VNEREARLTIWRARTVLLENGLPWETLCAMSPTEVARMAIDTARIQLAGRR
jgi:hypothetical protein